MVTTTTRNNVSVDVLRSINPATRETIGEVITTPVEEIPAIFAKARVAQKVWAAMSFRERREIMHRLVRVIAEDADAIAEMIVNENGKPRVEAYASEIVPACTLVQTLANKAEKWLKPERIRGLGPFGIMRLMGKKSWLTWQPFGVIGVISPWNYPFNLALGSTVSALLAGNAVVNKPSEFTPLIGKMTGDLFAKAGFPQNLVTIVQGYGHNVGAEVVRSSDKLFFTGSVGTGKKIMAMAADKLTPVVLELGGKDPMIVLDDADVKISAKAAVWGCFNNAGQTCAAVERVYVHESMYDDFVNEVRTITQSLRQDVSGDEREVGPIMNEMQFKKVCQQVDQARADGAEIIAGGKPNDKLPGYFYEPTVVVGAKQNSRLIQEETFGPVLPIMKYANIEEAIAMANDSKYGLCASVFSSSVSRGKEVASRILAGSVLVNDVLSNAAVVETPWQGIKQSGIGLTHSKDGLREFAQCIHIQTNPHRTQFYWHPYSANLAGALRNFTAGLFGGSAGGLVKGVRALMKHLKKK
ncbi:MAG: aldehyde dehydrogenase family protein [Planctomycetes bacterium]|nr:aldehyde dehydrogenase family protein [Planctomycetota bacterium]